MGTWLEKWTPEDDVFWKNEGSRRAWRTLTVTTIALILSFATWFMVSAIAVKLPGIGFKFDKDQLFWLTAMPGLAAGIFRIIHTFILPIYGSRHVITFATIIKLIPVIGLGFAVMDPSTPFWVFMVLAFTAGFGGGDFSSFMPSTSIHFPKRLQGTALGIQAGIGNFGVSVAQFMTPAMLGIATYGAAEVFTKTDPKTGEVLTSNIYLQSAAFWYAPLLIVLAIVAWLTIRSVPMKASIKEQMDIFKDKHTWFCTITYVMTFGGFSGLAAIFPLLIKTIYGEFPGAPDPLKYAFLGPLIGASSRVLFGFVADKVGGAILTTLTGVGMIAGCAGLVFTGALTPTSVDSFDTFLYLMLFLFFITGVGNAATFRQYPIVFGHNPRQAAGVIGWTAAVAAFGPFIFAISVSAVMKATGNANGFFYILAAFAVIATLINWWYYNRKGCERPS
ncbi:MAG: NarK/NasA family nitrate transporter [Crocinitomicaceae bacterium]|nr:NarK/NasA family nitrate transporter [Crocinitomicaceae bacterium]MBK8926233.1 NarK/NasA family nitrate transporter [Crocinitomicaceae bacterium]